MVKKYDMIYLNYVQDVIRYVHEGWKINKENEKKKAIGIKCETVMLNHI